MNLFDLDGYDELPKETQDNLGNLSASISNIINEIESTNNGITNE